MVHVDAADEDRNGGLLSPHTSSPLSHEDDPGRLQDAAPRSGRHTALRTVGTPPSPPTGGEAKNNNNSTRGGRRTEPPNVVAWPLPRSRVEEEAACSPTAPTSSALIAAGSWQAPRDVYPDSIFFNLRFGMPAAHDAPTRDGRHVESDTMLPILLSRKGLSREEEVAPPSARPESLAVVPADFWRAPRSENLSSGDVGTLTKIMLLSPPLSASGHFARREEPDVNPGSPSCPLVGGLAACGLALLVLVCRRWFRKQTDESVQEARLNGLHEDTTPPTSAQSETSPGRAGSPGFGEPASPPPHAARSRSPLTVEGAGDHLQPPSAAPSGISCGRGGSPGDVAQQPRPLKGASMSSFTAIASRNTIRPCADVPGASKGQKKKQVAAGAAQPRTRKGKAAGRAHGSAAVPEVGGRETAGRGAPGQASGQGTSSCPAPSATIPHAKARLTPAKVCPAIPSKVEPSSAFVAPSSGQTASPTRRRPPPPPPTAKVQAVSSSPPRRCSPPPSPVPPTGKTAAAGNSTAAKDSATSQASMVPCRQRKKSKEGEGAPPNQEAPPGKAKKTTRRSKRDAKRQADQAARIRLGMQTAKRRSTAKADPPRPDGASTATPDADTLPESGEGCQARRTLGGIDDGDGPEFVEPGVPLPDSGNVPASGVTVDAPCGRCGSVFAVDPPCRVEEGCRSGATAKTDPPCPDGGSTATPVVDTPSASGNGTPSSANSGSYSGSSPSSTPIIAADIVTQSVCGHQGARAAPKKTPKRSKGVKADGRLGLTFGLQKQRQEAGLGSFGSRDQGHSGQRAPGQAFGRSVASFTPPPAKAPDAKAGAPATKGQRAPGQGNDRGIGSYAPPPTATPGAKAGAPPKEMAAAGGARRSAAVPPTSLSNTGRKNPLPERSLLEVATLWKSMKPAICGVGRWYDGCRLVIDDDGNCFGLSWMTTALVGAAQSRRHTTYFIKQLKQLMGALKKGTFGDIDSISMGYVADVVSYAEELLGAWEQRPAAQLTTEFGVSLAVGVVRTLRGLSESGCRLECPQGGEPLWRRLKWGMTIAARAFDVSAAPGNFSQSFKEEDLLKLRTFGKSIEIDLSDMRPGRGLKFVVGLVVESISSAGDARTEDFTGHYCTLQNNEPCVPELAVLKTGLPHFDVFVAACPLGDALVTAFNLPPASNAATLAVIREQMKSQVQTTAEELQSQGFVSQAESDQQAELWKAIMANNAKKAQAENDKKAPATSGPGCR